MEAAIFVSGIMKAVTLRDYTQKQKRLSFLWRIFGKYKEKVRE